MLDVAVIGCGIVGAAAAYELSRYELSTVVLEAENDVSTGATKANSAIIHAGYDPVPGTLMAKLNVEGARLAKEICRKLDVPYKQIGSMVLALGDEDIRHVQQLYERGVKNRVPDIEILNAEQAKNLEPGISPDVAAALWAPTAAIVSPWEYAFALIETAVKNGVKLERNSKVEAIVKTRDGYRILTASRAFEARKIVNAAGIYADTIHNMIAPVAFKIQPNRGEYYLLDKSEGDRVSHVIFPCPTSEGKGVLVAPTVHGNLIVGPNAQDVSGEDLANTSQGLATVAKMAKKTVPGIHFRESIRNFAGLRALSDVDDFIIGPVKGCSGFIDLAGIKSPGLSSAPAIAKLAVELLADCGLPLREKAEFIDARSVTRFKSYTADEKISLIKQNPAYGRVICRCETITEGEIFDTMDSPIPPCSVDGVKRRCGAGMGRCQGGFCGPRVVDIIARELKISPLQVMQDRAGTTILTGETKQSKGGGANV